MDPLLETQASSLSIRANSEQIMNEKLYDAGAEGRTADIAIQNYILRAWLREPYVAFRVNSIIYRESFINFVCDF
ncbi:hypothetical protein NMG60_11034735 [Bertholletia excelsa]